MRLSESFKIWFDRWNGHRWCWRETKDSEYRRDGMDDVRNGENYGSRRDAREAIKDEIARRRLEPCEAAVGG